MFLFWKICIYILSYNALQVIKKLQETPQASFKDLIL